MIAYIEVPEEVTRIDAQLKPLAADLGGRVAAIGRKEHLGNGTDLFSIISDGFAIVQNGVFKYYFNNRLIRLYTTGDLLPVIPEHHENGCTCMSEFGAEVLVIGSGDLNRHWANVPTDAPLFIRYLSLHTTLMHILCSAFMTDDVHHDLAIKEYQPGNVIISQGDPAHEIYQMIQGDAIVTVDGIEVGSVAAGEVFGEISFFTESTRSATVTAKTGCLVQVMDKDEFVTLVKLKPTVNLSISKTLSNRIVETNRKIAGRKE